MTTQTADIAAAQDQLLEQLRQSQQLVLDTVRAVSAAAAKAAPAATAPAGPDLPLPADIVAGTFDFAERLLAAQREFAEQLVVAQTPPSVAVED